MQIPNWALKLKRKFIPNKPQQIPQGGMWVGYPGNFADDSARSHAIMSGTNTGRLNIQQQTERVRGRGGMEYNPDVPPYQHWLLKCINVSPFTASYREQLWLGSNLLKSVTEDQIWEIMADGWEYDPPMPELEEWDADRMNAFVEAMSKALVINSAYLTIWSDGTYRIFTTNDVYSKVYMNKHHKQAEIYFLYPSLVGAIAQDTENPFNAVPIGFLTQYSEDEERPARMTQNFTSFKGKMANTIFRECVMLQPKPSIHDIYGYSKMQIECDTGLQKIYLRSYEFAFLHKGGVNQTLAIHDKSDTAIKNAAIKNAARGLWSRGLILFTKGSKPVSDNVFVSETAIPPLFFGEISNLLSEDQQLSKQKAEGAADSGALGGQAPIVNEREDEKNLTSLINTLERGIRDTNFVFDGIVSDIEEKNKKGRIRRKPAYRVKFNKVVTMSVEEFTAQQQALEANQDDITEKNDANTTITPKPGTKKQDTKPKGNTVAFAHAVSVNDQYVSFRGNLFAPGIYPYPENGTSDIFTPTDIKLFTQNPINRAPLEVSHSMNPRYVGLNNDLGYSEVTGFDAVKNEDITWIHIKQQHVPQLQKEGIIVNDVVKLSPFFECEQDPVTNHKKIYNLNVALIDPKKERPRAELMGKKTQARRVN